MVDLEAKAFEALKTAFQASGLKQAQLAERSGLLQSLISRFFNGQAPVTISTAQKMAEGLGLTLQEILGSAEAPGPRIPQPSPKDALEIVAAALARMEAMETELSELKALYGKSNRSTDDLLDEVEGDDF